MGEFDSLMNQSVAIEGFNSYAADGSMDPSYNASVSYPAKIDLRIKKVVSLKGQDAVSTCLIVIPASVSLDLLGRDRITLPASMGSRQPVILAIENAIDNETGINDHWEVSC
jgi:hypothetical protein